MFSYSLLFFFLFNDTATTEIYTLSLHDALPISTLPDHCPEPTTTRAVSSAPGRSEEHTSELQSRLHLVCRLLLEKKNIRQPQFTPTSWHQPHRLDTHTPPPA